MITILKIKISLAIVLIFTAVAQVSAEPPILQASGPIIYLADNLDEQDQLGWCLDTEGPGLSEVLHTRACSADDESAERDFSFSFDSQSGQIKSESFLGKCVTINADGSEHAFGLFDCVSASEAQQFSYDDEQMTFHPRGREDICVSAAAMAMDHGPFRSRRIRLEVCADVDATLRQWVIKPL